MGEAKRNREDMLEEFKNNPEKFFHEEDIVMAIVKVETGMAVFHGAVSRPVMEQALTRLNYRTNLVFQSMDMEYAMKAKQRADGLIVPE